MRSNLLINEILSKIEFKIQPDKNIRKQFLNNEIPIQCKKVCYDKEQEGGHSHRQEMNQFWNNKEDSKLCEC